MADKQVRSGGIGFFGLLTILFVGLKLAEIGVVANWSWWLVLLPFYGPIALFLVFMVIVGLLIAIAD